MTVDVGAGGGVVLTTTGSGWPALARRAALSHSICARTRSRAAFSSAFSRFRSST